VVPEDSWLCTCGHEFEPLRSELKEPSAPNRLFLQSVGCFVLGLIGFLLLMLALIFEQCAQQRW
jgi:hypothetical protein